MKVAVIRTVGAVFRWLGLAAALLTLGGVRAADTRPVVGPGATKEDVINAYGWPTGQSKLGGKEVLNYPQGKITLADGKVERVDFSPNVQWAPPKPRPSAPTNTTVKRPEARTEFWTTSFADAVKEALGRRARILAAFVGSDWSPPSRRFLEEVAPSDEFYNAFTADFVFLKLDFPTRTAQPAGLKKQNEELRARCGVTTYPALIVMSARGDSVGVVDLMKARPEQSYLAQVIAAVAEVRDLLMVKLPPPEEAAPVPKAAAPGKPPAGARPAERRPEAERGPVAAVVATANWVLGLGLGGGALLAAVLVWWVWRSRVRVQPKAAVPQFSSAKLRLADVPTVAELSAWPVERLRSLVVAHFETTGYRGRVRRDGTDADVELLRPGHTQPSVLICCRSGNVGPVGAKVVRELFGTLVSTGVDSGWVISPAGFAPDARTLAAERGIELIDGEGLISRLQALDPMALARVLERVGA